MIAEKLLKMIPSLDARGFVVGSIAPDCNVESADWMEFTPPREITHWMSGVSKVTADYEGFFRKYVRPGLQRERYAFYLGYYAHLITDAEFHLFLRNEQRVCGCFERAKQDAGIRNLIAGLPEEFDTLKKVLGRKRMNLEMYCLEGKWLADNPENMYEGILLKVTEFPDYLDYLPEGAIARKIRVMQDEYFGLTPPDTFVFYTEEELNKFVDETARVIYTRLTRHGGWKMKAMKYLQEAVDEATCLGEMVDAFRNMCHMPIGADKEQLLFEAGVFSLPDVPEYRRGDIEECETPVELVTEFMEMEEQEMDLDQLLFPETETMFYFSLVRQFPDVEDEFFRIHMDVKFMPNANTQTRAARMWSDQIEVGGVKAVLDMAVVRLRSTEGMQDVCVYIDAT